MRGTMLAQIDNNTGNVRAVQLSLGNTKMDWTARYLSIDLEEALSISEGGDI